MRPAKGEKVVTVKTSKVELEMEALIIEQLDVMEKYTKIPKSELATIALRRFISQHKDYFPSDYEVK